jgi:hypothetical protein
MHKTFQLRSEFRSQLFSDIILLLQLTITSEQDRAGNAVASHMWLLVGATVRSRAASTGSRCGCVNSRDR